MIYDPAISEPERHGVIVSEWPTRSIFSALRDQIDRADDPCLDYRIVLGHIGQARALLSLLSERIGPLAKAADEQGRATD